MVSNEPPVVYCLPKNKKYKPSKMMTDRNEKNTAALSLKKTLTFRLINEVKLNMVFTSNHLNEDIIHGTFDDFKLFDVVFECF